MDGCDGFELAIEMRLHDALPPEEGAALDAHLVTCERCREFQRNATETQRALTGAAGALADAVDPGEVWGRVQRMVREDRSRLWKRALLFLVLAPALGILLGHFLVGAGTVAVVATGVLTALALQNRALTRELTLVGRSPEDVLALHRSLLSRRLARAVRMRSVLPVLAVLELFLTRPGAPWPKSLDREPMAVFAVCLAVVCLARTVYLARKVIPALRRELEASR